MANGPKTMTKSSRRSSIVYSATQQKLNLRFNYICHRHRPSPNMMEHGSALAVAKSILLRAGFEVDKRYHSLKRQADKVRYPSEPIAWKLISMADDGTATLQAYSFIGELMVDKFTTVSGQELSAMFGPFENVFKLCTKYRHFRNDDFCVSQDVFFVYKF